MGSDEGKGGSVACGGISGILGLVFFIYLMVAFSTVNLKDLTGLVPDYVNMINWVKTLAFVEFGIIGSMFVFAIVGICCIAASENAGPAIAILLFAIIFLSTFIIQIVFVAQGVPIKNNADHICQQSFVNSNYTQMCDFHNNYYNPLFIILCVLLALNCLNFLIIGVAGLIACCTGV